MKREGGRREYLSVVLFFFYDRYKHHGGHDHFHNQFCLACAARMEVTAPVRFLPY